MRLNEYQDMSARTAPPFEDKTEEIVAWAMGINGESGEIADIVKKSVWHGHEWNPEKVALEIGDVLYYLARLSYVMGYTLEEVATMNIMKLQKRYPNGFSNEASINRKEE